MVRGAVKAMDAIQQYVHDVAVPGFKIENFHVTGDSSSHCCQCCNVNVILIVILGWKERMDRMARRCCK